MKGKWILIILVVVAASLGLYFVFRPRRQNCPPVRNTAKFPAGWKEDRIPSGDLNRLAGQYVTPIIGGTDQENGSILGGFFKGIDVYPSDAAARYYREWLEEYLASDNALPHWNIEQGELLCENA